ncbi:phage tail-collar fiber domain-containing protein [Hafnia paralvei]|uniref:phage tail-collar fiber domain-containing protein n=1 Tax=Hafnia paralvei TaxID=546367 RepID=UPI0010339081|nr:phage tail protein [Hafnia paralvei]TBM25670.1 phage tail protein [Hafnia paralvei]
MGQKYKAVLTKIGAAKIAAATAGGTKINLTHMAVGDGGGSLPTPDPAQTKLIAEKHRAALNKVIVDPKKKNYLVAELVIPPEVGGFWMRELGLYDDTGALIAVSNMAESYKPLLSEGSGRAQTLRMVLIVSDMDTVNLLIDSSTVLATQEYVDEKLLEHEQSRRHPAATLKEKGFTQLSNATNSDSEALAATPKAVKAAYDLASGKYTAQDASTAQKGIVQLSSATNSASETLAATPKAVKAAYDKAAEADKNAKTADENAGKANENANTRLEKDKNLSDLSDKPLARKNLALGTAATSNVQKSITDNTPNALMINGAWGLGASGVGMVDSDILSPTSIGNTFFNQGGGAANSHFGGYGTGIHLSYGSNGDNKQRLTANLFVDSAGNLSVEWLAVNKSDGAIVVKRIQKLYGPLNKPSASDIRAFPDNGILPTGTNLNTLTGTKQGFYFQSTNSNATTALNYPVNSAGSLCVMRNGANGNDGCTQEYRPYNSSVVFSRIYDVASNKWSVWDYIYSKNNPPSASAVGALPIGGGTLNGNLTVKNTLQVGGVGNAAINIGDNDSGLRSSVDGQVDLYANGRMYGYWNTTTLGFAGQIIPSNYNNFDARYINNLQMGAEEYKDIPYPGQASIPLGACITAIVGTTKPTGGGVGFYISRVYFRRIQKYIGGSWKNIA